MISKLDHSSEIRRHDAFNIVSLFIISTINLVYFSLITDVSKIGTSELGKDHKGIFFTLYASSFIYFIIDTLWILFNPNAILANPNSIITHHFISILFITIPAFIDPQFSWHMSALLLLEINILIMTIRRSLSNDSSIIFHILNILFYLTWVLFRLIMLPTLLVFFVYEYIRISISLGGYFNYGILAIIFQTLITWMSYQWTIDLVIKKIRNK
jgi:hypothetical protein